MPASWFMQLQLGLKRLIDIMVSAFGLILLSPIILIFALAVRLDSPGSSFYRHCRIGKDGKPFDLFKFRSMAVGNDDQKYQKYLEELIQSSKIGQGKPYRKMDDDPRVTRWGRIIRRFYLDEFPQLWNIFKGDMSLVGPRPHVQLEVDHYSPEQWRRLSVRPGATGLWQVDGKTDCTFDEMIELDLYYIDHWSLALDIQLILRTLLSMLRDGRKALASLRRRPAARQAATIQDEMPDQYH